MTETISKSINSKIEEIKTELLNKKLNKRNDLSLMGGYIGELLFYYSYCKHNEKTDYKIEERVVYILNKIITSINRGYLYPTYSDGLAGIRWGIHFLNEHGFIEIEEDDSFDKIDEYLYKEMINFISVGNFDYLHGAMGIAIYFLGEVKKNKKYDEYVKDFIKQLLSKSVILNNGIAWRNYSPKNNGDEFNLGLSHGIPSIINFLSKCTTEEVLIKETSSYLNGAVKFIMESKLKQKSVSIFSNFNSDIKPSRLAWCYGDLGIASSIWQAGIALYNEKWKEDAIQIMLHNTCRRDLETNGVHDAGLCHGTAGIAHIFNRFYKETKLKEFDDARWYWLEQTLNFATHDKGLAGFKNWQGKEGWQNDYGLLEGVAGIGLMLLGFLSNDIEDLDWDRVLLLS